MIACYSIENTIEVPKSMQRIYDSLPQPSRLDKVLEGFSFLASTSQMMIKRRRKKTRKAHTGATN
jgi:hypothetical protein